MKIHIASYDPSWEKMFEEESKILSEIFGEIPHHIEHIGSTAVEGLAAKPIIDSMVGLDDFSVVANFIDKISQAGYTYISTYEDVMPYRRFFTKQLNGEKTHHLHVVEFDSEFWKRHLKFRNHLRENAVDRNAYEQLKRKLAEQKWETGNDYAEAKTEFIRNIEKDFTL